MAWPGVAWRGVEWSGVDWSGVEQSEVDTAMAERKGGLPICRCLPAPLSSYPPPPHTHTKNKSLKLRPLKHPNAPPSSPPPPPTPPHSLVQIFEHKGPHTGVQLPHVLCQLQVSDPGNELQEPRVVVA
jgi:hypothetical protein